MRKYTLTFLQKDFQHLGSHLFGDDSVEQAAIVYCTRSVTDSETRLMVKEIQPIQSEEIEGQSALHIRVPDRVYSKAFQKCAKAGLSFFWVHSHPRGELEYSEIDDREEPELLRAANIRAPGLVHGSLLMNHPDQITGRVLLPNELSGVTPIPLDTIRVIGTQYQFFFPVTRPELDLSAFDRNIRAFGRDMQNLLKNLHVGVVGNSGTGSPAVEQLARLGVGTLSLYDDDLLTETNLTRIHGSAREQIGQRKIDIMEQMINGIGLGTKVIKYGDRVSKEDVAKTLRDCDLIFGCTDDQLGRAILNDISLRYYIPYIDTGISIESKQEVLQDIVGRVTLVQPGHACLLCLGVVSPKAIAYDSMPGEVRDQLVKQGYAPELTEGDPAVIAYTTLTSSLAVAEMINRLTGFTREMSRNQLVYNFGGSRRMLSIMKESSLQCKCGQTDIIGSGDTPLFLDQVW